MDPIMGSIMIFAGTFAPRGWALCNGQLMSIAQNSALFSILGTTYGGDGVNTFGLPDMQGRSCLSAGQGGGLKAYTLGEKAGTNSASITTANLPSAPVVIRCSTAVGTTFEPAGMVPASAENANEAAIYGNPATGPGVMAPATLQGGNQPLNVNPPYLVMNWCIATEGIYPSRP
jgi:microcystin-dependent protein